ncbi:MAG: phosphoribosyltransferase family protein [Bacteroidota bacterium]
MNLFFPKVCEGCRDFLNDNEILLCTSCRHELPVTNFHFDDNKSVEKVLYGRVKLQNATSLVHFSKKSIVQELLHNLKYRGHEDIGAFFGKWLGAELSLIEAYKDVDVVIPVPLHKSKLRKRGYNQVSKFGKSIADALQINYDDNALKKTARTKTQVFKGRLKRSNKGKTLFSVADPERLQHKHILLVDDIITTGATVEACAEALSGIEGLKISLATIAIAD